MRIKAIETSYAGCRFRSRTEARWAAFFDSLGIPWEYEREGFELKSGRYLPDFWLPEQDCWIEIKGRRPTDREQTKARELGRITRCEVYLFWGVPRCPDGVDREDAPGWRIWPDWDSWQLWMEDSCGRIAIRYPNSNAREMGARWDSERLQAAYTAARSARFGR